MKIDEPRVTEYALGELHGRAREEFEKELAQSDELQRELEGTVIFCQKLGALPLDKKDSTIRPARNCRQSAFGMCRRSDSGGIASAARRCLALSVRSQLVS